jgi:hypothetical protein
VECGLHAIANAVELLLGFNPGAVELVVASLRSHFVDCLKAEQLSN